MRINLQSKSYYIISVLVFLAISCNVVKQQEKAVSTRGQREGSIDCLLPGVKCKTYYLDSTTQIAKCFQGIDSIRIDTLKVSFTPVKDRNNWLNDTVRRLPTINGEDVLDTIRHYKR